jgi:predicted secreted hydrolase
MNARAALLALLLPATAWAQGYAGLGSEADGFARVTAPADLQFPRDHQAHEGFRIEWWYLTAILDGEDGAEYGVQWTLFRQAADPGPEGEGFGSPVLWMGHAALTTRDDHRYAERFARGGIGQAGVKAGPFEAWIDDWSMRGVDDGIGELRITASGEAFAYDLRAATRMPPVPQGEAGFSVKSEAGQASYYYSQPFYEIDGTLTVDDREVAVTGSAWLDREWSSQPLAEDQEGWDWFSLVLPDGGRVMVYGMRHVTDPAYVVGTWIAPDGTPTPLAPGDVVLTPTGREEVDGRPMPVRWRIEIPDFGFAVDTEPLNARSWMGTAFPYWEGPIRFEGSHAGRGYLEMTGW